MLYGAAAAVVKKSKVIFGREEKIYNYNTAGSNGQTLFVVQAGRGLRSVVEADDAEFTRRINLLLTVHHNNIFPLDWVMLRRS